MLASLSNVRFCLGKSEWCQGHCSVCSKSSRATTIWSWGALHTYSWPELSQLSGFWHANCSTVLQCFGPLYDVGLKLCVVLLLMFYTFYDPFNKPLSDPIPLVCMHFPLDTPHIRLSLWSAPEAAILNPVCWLCNQVQEFAENAIPGQNTNCGTCYSYILV